MRALDAGLSRPMKPASHVKCSPASSRRDRDQRHVQVAADRLGDLAGGDAFVGDRVQGRSRRCGLEREPEQACRVEAVHGGPAARSVAQVAGDALVAGDGDESRHEAVVAVAVHGRWEPEHGRADAAGGEGECELGGGPTGAGTRAEGGRRLLVVSVLFGCEAARREPERPRGDDERPVGAGEGLAEGFDCPAICVGRALEVARLHPLVLEGEVDDAVRGRCCGAKDVEVVEVAALDRRTRGGEEGG